MDAVVAHPIAFLSVLKNRPLDALRLGQAQGSGWWIQWALYSTVTALFVTVLVGRSGQVGMGIMGDITGLRGLGGYYSAPYWVMEFGDGLVVLLLSFVLFGLINLLRVAMLHISFAVGKAGVPFSASGQIVTTAYAGHLCVLAVGILGLIVPGEALGTLILTVGAFVLMLLNFMSELLMYIGVNRRHRFTGSPLMPFVLGYGGWVIGVGVILYVFASVLKEM